MATGTDAPPLVLHAGSKITRGPDGDTERDVILLPPPAAGGRGGGGVVSRVTDAGLMVGLPSGGGISPRSELPRKATGCAKEWLAGGDIARACAGGGVVCRN